MKIPIRARIYFLLLVVVVIGLLLSACDSSSSVPTLPAKPSAPPSVTPPPANTPTAPVNRVDIVYFHPKIRCGACIYVELEARHNLEAYFKGEMDSGILTFQSYELKDKANEAIIKKYGAMSSQLFVNTVKNGVENIKHIEEVWMPNILNDGVAFDEFFQKLIKQSLKEVK